MKQVALIYYPDNDKYCVYLGEKACGVNLEPDIAVDRFQEAVILAKKVSS